MIPTPELRLAVVWVLLLWALPLYAGLVGLECWRQERKACQAAGKLLR